MRTPTVSDLQKWYPLPTIPNNRNLQLIISGVALAAICTTAFYVGRTILQNVFHTPKAQDPKFTKDVYNYFKEHKININLNNYPFFCAEKDYYALYKWPLFSSGGHTTYLRKKIFEGPNLGSIFLNVERMESPTIMKLDHGNNASDGMRIYVKNSDVSYIVLIKNANSQKLAFGIDNLSNGGTSFTVTEDCGLEALSQYC